MKTLVNVETVQTSHVTVVNSNGCFIERLRACRCSLTLHMPLILNFCTVNAFEYRKKHCLITFAVFRYRLTVQIVPSAFPMIKALLPALKDTTEATILLKSAFADDASPYTLIECSYLVGLQFGPQVLVSHF